MMVRSLLILPYDLLGTPGSVEGSKEWNSLAKKVQFLQEKPLFRLLDKLGVTTSWRCLFYNFMDSCFSISRSGKIRLFLKKISSKVCYFALGLILICSSLFANNLQFTNFQQKDPSTFSVEISWENAWNLEGIKAPNNHDAVWVFLKYQAADGEWKHADLKSGISLSSRLEVLSVDDQKGLFVKLAAPDSGNVLPSMLEINLSVLPESPVNFRLFGIEMVAVNEGPFWLGDEQSFYHLLSLPDSSVYMVEGEEAIVEGSLGAKELYAPHGTIPAVYPKGYAPFYAMKYEITQGQYRDFLNCLSFSQQTSRTNLTHIRQANFFALVASQTALRRNGIYLKETGSDPNIPGVFVCNANPDQLMNAFDDGQDRACNQLNWEDICAYLDWAALRPLSELEFEKATRGPAFPIARGFAWGTDQVIDANTVLEDGTSTERVEEEATEMAGLASHGYLGPDGPLRSGFGGSASSSRLQIGGSYYGILEMSGNLWELVVNVDSLGLAFEGTHGNGELSEEGAFDVSDWPRGAGAGHRGGALNSGIVGPYRDLAISDRFYIELYPDQRRNTTGGRGGRSMD